MKNTVSISPMKFVKQWNRLTSQSTFFIIIFYLFFIIFLFKSFLSFLWKVVFIFQIVFFHWKLFLIFILIRKIHFDVSIRHFHQNFWQWKMLSKNRPKNKNRKNNLKFIFLKNINKTKNNPLFEEFLTSFFPSKTHI